MVYRPRTEDQAGLCSKPVTGKKQHSGRRDQLQMHRYAGPVCMSVNHLSLCLVSDQLKGNLHTDMRKIEGVVRND